MDKVKLHAQERLDLDDTRALQSLIYDYVQEALGGLMGNAHGVLSVPQAFTSENGGAPIVYFRPFTFLTSMPMEIGSTGQTLGTSVVGGTEYTQFKSTVVNYDPEEQTTQGIDIDWLRANFLYALVTFGAQYIWARPVYIDTDTATRRKWDVASGAEVTVSVETRESQRVAFVIQNAEPSYATGEARWAKIAQITGFTDGDNTGSTPIIEWFSVFDDALINTLLDTSDTVVGMQSILALRGDTPFENNKSYRTFALPLLLTELRKQIAEIKGLGPLLPWTSPQPVNSDLVSLSARLIALESRQVSPVQCIASCRLAVVRTGQITDTYQAYLSSFIGPSSGIDTNFTGIPPTTVAQQNLVRIKILDSVLDEGWSISHVSVTQDIVYLQNNDHRDYNRVTFLVHPNAYSTDSSDTSTMHLFDYTSSDRGIMVEFLPQLVLAESHSHTENDIHPPIGTNTGTTTVLDYLNTTPDQSSLPPYDLVFSVAVFATPVVS